MRAQILTAGPAFLAVLGEVVPIQLDRATPAALTTVPVVPFVTDLPTS